MLKKRKTYHLIFKQTILIFCMTLCVNLNAQHNQMSLGFGLGSSQYLGDLAEDFNYKHISPSIDFGVGYKFSEKALLELSYLKTSIFGADSLSKDASRLQRNLSFKSKINELNLIVEYEPFTLFSRKGFAFSPVIKSGIGVFTFDPIAVLNGKEYALQSLSTEGQGLPNSTVSPYRLLETSLIYGFGLKLKYKNICEFAFDISPRVLKTDYLDDVSGYYYNSDAIRRYVSNEAAQLSNRTLGFTPGEEQFPNNSIMRGNPNKNDQFIISNFKFRYFIPFNN